MPGGAQRHVAVTNAPRSTRSSSRWSDSGPDATPDLRISHVGYDRKHTSAKDPSTWFPLERLREAVRAGRLGALKPRFYGSPTNRSQRVTIERYAPELLARCREDAADAALIVPT